MSVHSVCLSFLLTMQPLIIAIVFTKDRNVSLTSSYNGTFVESFFDLTSIGISLVLRKISGQAAT